MRGRGSILDAPVSRRRAVRILLVVNYLSIAVVMVQGVVLVPLYLSHLGATLYGSWLATGNVLAWLSVVDPGVSSIVQQRVAAAAGARDRAELGRLMGAGLWLAAGLFAAAAALGLACTPLVPQVARLPAGEAEALTRAFAWMAVVNAATLAYYVVAGTLIGLQLGVSIGAVYLGGSVAGLAATILGLLAGWGLPALVIGRAVTVGVWLLGNLVILFAWVLPGSGIRLDLRPGGSRELLSLARITFVARVASTFAANLDAFLVNLFLGPGPVVVLSTTQKAADVASLSVNRIGAAFMPGLAHAAGAGEAEVFAGVSLRLLRLVLAGLALVAGGVVALNGAFVSLWVGPALFGGRLLTVALVAAMAAAQAGALLSSVLFARGDVRATSLASLLEAAGRVALLGGALAAGAGLLAAPLSALAASGGVLAGLLAPRFARHLGAGRLGRELRPLLAPAIGIAVLAALVNLAPPPQGWAVFAAEAAGFAAAAAALLLTVRPLRAELPARLRGGR